MAKAVFGRTVLKQKPGMSMEVSRVTENSDGRRSWAGLPVLYLGRLANTGGRIVLIGEPCGECSYGRIILSCGILRCNTCQHALGELRRFEDEGFSADRAIEILRDEAERSGA